MGFWIVFWTWFLVATALVFAVLAVVVSIGGFKDLKRLFRTLGEKERPR